MRWTALIASLLLGATTALAQPFAFGYKVTAGGTPPLPDTLDRETELANVWFLDDGMSVAREETSHPWRLSSLNYVGNGGAQDTVKLNALRNEVIAFQVILVGNDTKVVDSVEVWLDSLDNGTTVITNDSMRTRTDPFWYPGVYIEHFVEQYPYKTGDIDSTTYTDGRYNGGWYNASPQPRSSYLEKTFAHWLIPCEAPSGEYNNGQGGYPIKVFPVYNQGIWIDIWVPAEATAGTYNGRLKVEEGGAKTWSIPVQLIVQDYALSDTNWFEPDFQFYENAITYAHGKTAYDASWDSLFHAYGRYLKRNGIGILTSTTTPTRFASDYMGMFSGWWFSAAEGYDGRGQDIGYKWYFIGMYDLEAGIRIDQWSDTLESTTAYGADNASSWQDSLDKWEQMFQDSLGDGGSMANTVRAVYLNDEWEGSPLWGALYQQWYLRQRIGRVHNLGYPASNLPVVQTSATIRALFQGDYRSGNTIDIYSMANNPTDTSWWGAIQGYGECLERLIQNVSPYQVEQPRIFRANHPGVKLGYYNAGTRQGNPVRPNADYPLTDPIAAGWVDFKYDVDHWWNWQSIFAYEQLVFSTTSGELYMRNSTWECSQQSSWGYWNMREGFEDIWDNYQHANISQTTSSGLYWKYGNAVQIAVTGTIGAGELVCAEDVSDFEVDSTYRSVFARVKANRTLGVGDIAILFDNTSQCASPHEDLHNMEIYDSSRIGHWELMRFESITHYPQGAGTIAYMGFKTNVVLSAGDTIWLDDMILASKWSCVNDTIKNRQHRPYGADFLIPGTDTIYTADSRGINGPIGRIGIKTIRRGAMDYQYLHEAERLGVDVAAVYNQYIGGAFMEMGSSYTGPYPARQYDIADGPLITNGSHADFNNLSQKQWPDSSNYYETMRRALADSIIARSQ